MKAKYRSMQRIGPNVPKYRAPRRACPDDEELAKLGEQLVEWATEETNELRCRFAQWYSLIQGISSEHWVLMLRKPVFYAYYEQARVGLAQRYMDGTICPSIAHRFLRIFTPEVKEEEEWTAEKDAIRSKEIASTIVDPEAHSQIIKLNELIKNRQSERKISLNNINPEQ